MEAASNIGSIVRALLRQTFFIQERPLVPLFLCLACGILLCNRQLVGWIVPALLMLPLAVGFIIALWLNKKLSALIFIYGAAILTGMLIMAPYISPPPASEAKPSYASRAKNTYRGFIDDSPQPSRNRTEYTLSGVRAMNALKAEPIPGRVLLDAKVTDRFRYGDYVQFRARLVEPRNFNNPGGFDYREYLFRKGILQRTTITHPSDLILIRRGLGNPVKAGIESYRDRLRDFVSRHTDSPEREILLAMILGEQKTIPDDLRERFNRTGTSHIIAMSGFNVGMIAFYSFLFFMTALKIHPSLLLAWNAPKVAYALSLIPIILYTVIAGMGTPVVRATLMVITMMTALMIGKPKDLINALALAAIIIVAVSPPSLFDPSFQLSFAAVAAILCIPPKFTPFLPASRDDNDTKLNSYFRKGSRAFLLFLLVSASATLGTLPIIAYHFHRLSTVVIPANIAVVPFLGILTTPMSLLTIIVYPLSQSFCLILIHGAVYLIQISVFFVNFFSALPASSFQVPPPAWYEILAYYLMLTVITALPASLMSKGRTAAWRLIRTPAVLAFAVFVVILTGILFHSYLSASPPPQLKLTMLDVGQGSSTLIQVPGGKTMLVDGGGFEGSSFDVGRYVVAPYLIRQKILKLDVVVLTHPHPDHMNGLLYILENFSVGEVWTNGDSAAYPSYDAFRDIIRRKKLAHRILVRGQPDWNLDGLHIQILNPSSETASAQNTCKDYRKQNDRSLVLHLHYGKVGILLPGDISRDAEDNLTAMDYDLKSDILLAPHHGGKTSSMENFLEKVRPTVVVFGCGLNNRYKTPHPETIRRYERMGVKMYRTDRDGAVIFKTDGTQIADGNNRALFP